MRRRPDHALCLTGLVWLAGCGYTLPTPSPPATPKVTVSQPVARDVRDYTDFTGHTDAVSTVEIRARVTGYLDKVTFTDGEIVKEKALLYQIDPRPFQDELDRVKGDLERLNAKKKLMDIQVERYRGLVAKGATPQETLDEYLAQQAENIGSIKSTVAQEARAALNLEFTRVTAPITGKIDRTLITPGNLVTADTTVLTKIVTIDPMYAYIDVDEPSVLRVQKMVRDGVIQSRNIHAVEVIMGLDDDIERKFPLKGTLDFVSNTLDPQTGTIVVRGVFSNPYKAGGPPPMLTPGLFVRVRLYMGPPHPAFLVTERAIGTDQGQKFVFAVGEGNRVSRRVVKLGQVFDGLQAIEDGVKADDRVVVNGLQRIRAGIQVEPEPVDMLTLAGPAQPEPRRIVTKPVSATKTTDTTKPAADKPTPAGAAKSPDKP
jgi:RND family efflux transporter MFP subunit